MRKEWRRLFWRTLRHVARQTIQDLSAAYAAEGETGIDETRMREYFHRHEGAYRIRFQRIEERLRQMDLRQERTEEGLGEVCARIDLLDLALEQRSS